MVNDNSKIYTNTGAEVVKSDHKESEVMHKTTGDLSQNLPDPAGLAKASPSFKAFKPDAKTLGSKEAQKEAIRENIIGGGSGILN